MMVRQFVAVFALASASLAWVAACSSDTGIIVAVSGSSADSLEFYVAVGDGDRFVIDQAASGGRVDVAGRNLRSLPYELLLREHDSSTGAAQMRVVALAFRKPDGDNEAKLSGVALTDPPQRFIRGEVVRRAISIRDLSDRDGVDGFGNNCFSVWRIRGDGDKKRFELIAADDTDCDGHTLADTPPDCDDSDGSIYPGAPELCDGKDNDCDAVASQASEDCYLLEGGTCLAGVRSCSEKLGGPPQYEPCSAKSTAPVASVLCREYHGCSNKSKPLRCVARVAIEQLSCDYEQWTEGGVSKGLCPAGVLPLSPPSGHEPQGCGWQVVRASGVEAKLASGPPQSKQWSASVDTCSAELGLFATGLEPGANAVVEFTGEPALVVRLTVAAKSVDQCSPNPLHCSSQ